jgi:hypothetical protein
MALACCITCSLVVQFGDHIPDVQKMHSMWQQQADRPSTNADGVSESIDRSKTSAVVDPVKDAESLKQIDAVEKLNLPTPMKVVGLIGMGIFEYAPWPVGLFVIALLIMLVNGIWFNIHAFRKSVFWGLGCLCVPLVSKVFEYKFWPEVSLSFQVGMFTSILFGVVFGSAYGATQFVPSAALKTSFADEISRFKQLPARDARVLPGDICIGQNNDIFFEAALAAEANSVQGRAHLEAKVKNKGKNSIVTFDKGKPLTVAKDDMSISNNRDSSSAAIETAFLKNYDPQQIAAGLAKGGTPAIAVVLQLLEQDREVSYAKASDLSAFETEVQIGQVLEKGLPVVISAKRPKEIRSSEHLQSPCYAVVSINRDTHQALLYDCRFSEKSTTKFPETSLIPGFESVGNGLCKVPLAAFPKYVRFLAFPNVTDEQK